MCSGSVWLSPIKIIYICTYHSDVHSLCSEGVLKWMIQLYYPSSTDYYLGGFGLRPHITVKIGPFKKVKTHPNQHTASPLNARTGFLHVHTPAVARELPRRRQHDCTGITGIAPV